MSCEGWKRSLLLRPLCSRDVTNTSTRFIVPFIVKGVKEFYALLNFRNKLEKETKENQTFVAASRKPCSLFRPPGLPLTFPLAISQPSVDHEAPRRYHHIHPIPRHRLPRRGRRPSIPSNRQQLGVLYRLNALLQLRRACEFRQAGAHPRRAPA